MCEFELRCVNSDKCYRCFNESLLKLPEDKQKKRNNKTTSFNSKKANSDDSWKDLEEQVAIKLNKVPTIKEARRTLCSGALFEKGDVLDDILLPECKERIGTELKGGDKSISLKKDWLLKAKKEAQQSDKKMCLPFRFKAEEDIYVIMDFDDLADLITTMKAYKLDNEIKEQEIRLLKGSH
jgi:hypothetical protein